MDDAPTIRGRFPPPWRIETTPGGCKVTDAEGHSLAYLYASERPYAPQPNTAECQSIARVVCAVANGLPLTIDFKHFPAPWQAVEDNMMMRIVDGHKRSLVYLYAAEQGATRALTWSECRVIAVAVCVAVSRSQIL